MTIVRTWTFLGMMVVGLFCGQASLWAQSASEPAPAGGEPSAADGEPVETEEPDKPWNESVSIETRAAARELFLEGNRLSGMLLFARAAEKYTAALAKWKHPRLFFNLAVVQIYLDKEVEARENLEHALAHGEEPLGEYFQEAQKHLQELTRQLGRIRVTCQTKGAEVSLDGTTVFIGPGHYEAWVKAKAHELTAKRAGYQSEARRVTVSAGELLNVDLTLVTLSQAADTSRRWAVWKPWAVISAGMAVAVVGSGLHSRSYKNFDDYDRDFSELGCVRNPDPKHPGCSEAEIGSDLNSKLRRAKRQQAVAVGSYVAGGSLIAVGVVLLYLNRPHPAESAVNPSLRGIAVSPAISGDMLGIHVSVTR